MAIIVEIPTAPVNGSSETQRLTVGGGTPTSGNIVVKHRTRTVTIPWNATATQFRDALRGLNEIGPTGVTGSGGPLPGTPIDIAFAARLANQDEPQMTIASHTLSAGTPAITTTVAGVTASPRGMSAGTVVVAKDTGRLYVNRGTATVPVWRMLVDAVVGATLTDLVAASGTADGTVDDVGGAFAQATLNNNFKEMAVRLNAVTLVLRNAGMIP